MSGNGRPWRRSVPGSALWAVPVACMAAALLLAPLVRWADARTGWPLLGFGPDGAKAVVGGLAASLLTFVVFAFSILLLAVQVAGGQLTPRIVARAFESRIGVATLGAFVFAWVYSLAALGRIEERVPQLPVLVAVMLGLGCVVLFLHMVRAVSLGFRPITVMTRVAEDTAAAIDVLHTEPFAGDGREGETAPLPPGGAARTLLHEGAAGAVRTVDLAALAAIASRAGCAVEVVPRVGDFVHPGGELFRLHGEGAAGADGGSMRRCVVLGPERILDHDPAFGFRILVDIAIKALSPAINDPTTGVLALDQLEHLLRRLGGRRLEGGAVRDGGGAVRVAYRAIGWDDYVSLAFTEIRLCGATSPQVARRLRAALDRLAALLPEERLPALRREEGLLSRTVERSFSDPEERRQAGAADLQGFGSPLGIGGEGAP